jgi:hypothetical protein
LKANEAPNRVPAESAPDRLYCEIERLKMEFDWLKKIRDQPAMIHRGWIGAHAVAAPLEY